MKDDGFECGGKCGSKISMTVPSYKTDNELDHTLEACLKALRWLYVRAFDDWFCPDCQERSQLVAQAIDKQQTDGSPHPAA